MPATFFTRNAKLLIPSLIVLSLFLSACSSSNSSATTSPSPANTALNESVNTQLRSPDVAGASTMSADAQFYDKVVHYNNPAGGDDVHFTLTVSKDGVIEDAQAEVLAEESHMTSVKMQTNFANEVKTAVVGKKLAGLKVDRIGGASLTTGAFNQFLSTINS